MKTFKFLAALAICTFFVQSALSQKVNQIKKSASVSNLIATVAPETEILTAWESLVLQKQIKSYSQAEQLMEQTMQKAYLQGNRYLGASITRTAFYSTLAVELSKEIANMKLALRKEIQSNITEKNFKLKPDSRDLQRLAGIGKIDLDTQRKLRFNLVNKAQSVLSIVSSIITSKAHRPATTGNNKQQISPNIFFANDVIISNGGVIKSKEQLSVYLSRLEKAYVIADTNLKASASQLHNMTMTQQQMAQNESTLKTKLLKKAASIIH
jgi:hypothetical protein